MFVNSFHFWFLYNHCHPVEIFKNPITPVTYTTYCIHWNRTDRPTRKISVQIFSGFGFRLKPVPTYLGFRVPCPKMISRFSGFRIPGPKTVSNISGFWVSVQTQFQYFSINGFDTVFQIFRVSRFSKSVYNPFWLSDLKKHIYIIMIILEYTDVLIIYVLNKSCMVNGK